jgi:hypothetical protein
MKASIFLRDKSSACVPSRVQWSGKCFSRMIMGKINVFLNHRKHGRLTIVARGGTGRETTRPSSAEPYKNVASFKLPNNILFILTIPIPVQTSRMPRSSLGCFGDAGKMDTTRIKKTGRDCRKLGWILESLA